MVESLRELNRIVQKPKYRENGNLMVRYFLRDAALPATWLLLHTSVTANQVTVAALMIGLAGIFFLALPGTGFFLLGAFLLQFWYYLDHVDGQIARYRKTSSLSGRFFDFIMHHLIHGVLFFALGWSVYQSTGRIAFVVWGFITSVSMMMFNLIFDTKYKTFFEKILTLGAVKNLEMASRAAAPAEDETPAVKPLEAPSFSRRIFSVIHKLAEIHIVMSVLTLAAIFEIVFHFSWSRVALFVFYGICVPILAVAKTTYFISGQKLDIEFHNSFREIPAP